MQVAALWHSADPNDWDDALRRYWDFIQPRNMELERALDKLDRHRIESLSPRGWYDFLHDEYFRWKYTAPNRYATTTAQLRKYLDGGNLGVLDSIRRALLVLNPTDVRGGLMAAKGIRGLGVAGASGLLSLMYPAHFATVDQFVVKALREVGDVPEADLLDKMKPENLTVANGVVLIGILHRRATENNRLFGTSTWTPRKIDMVLWTFGR